MWPSLHRNWGQKDDHKLFLDQEHRQDHLKVVVNVVVAIVIVVTAIVPSS